MNEIITTNDEVSNVINTGQQSLAIQIMLDDKLFERTKAMAQYMAKAEGITPRHLINKSEACFAVVMRSLTWKLDPYAVAMSTYQTPGGSVGFEGKLCQAILENSGGIEGNVKFEHYGDWSRVQGKFEIATSGKGGQYPKRLWNQADAKGIGVRVKAKVKNEDKERVLEFDLSQAFPLNSTLWATDPKTQICYTAVRRFASTVTPGLFMGVPFDHEDTAPISPKNITPTKPSTSTIINIDALSEDVEEVSEAVNALEMKVQTAVLFLSKLNDIDDRQKEFDNMAGPALIKQLEENNMDEAKQQLMDCIMGQEEMEV